MDAELQALDAAMAAAAAHGWQVILIDQIDGVWTADAGLPTMTPRQIDQLIERLDSHSAKLDQVRSDVDKLKGGLIAIAALLFSVLVPLLASLLSK